MADLGARAYRFSISWSRVLPTGTGAINQPGLDFYQRLVDALLGAGVQPLINLFHWDLPQALQDRGGFANPEVVGWFTDYAALLASNLGDRVKDWMTFNEPAVFAFLGHADGIHAPGLRDWPTAIRVADNELRAHAAADRGDPRPGRRREDRRGDRRQPGRAGDRFGARSSRRRPVELRSRRVVPRSALRSWLPDAGTRSSPRGGSPRRHRPRRAAGRRSRLPGPELLPARLGQRQVGPRVRLGDRRRAGTRSRRRWAGTSRPTVCATYCSSSTRRTHHPRSWSPRTAPPTPIPSIGTAGCATWTGWTTWHATSPRPPRRSAAGVPLTGYYVWSLLDNYEWSLGYSRRFGLVHVDFDSQRRTPKDSARWYQRLIAGE